MGVYKKKLSHSQTAWLVSPQANTIDIIGEMLIYSVVM